MSSTQVIEKINRLAKTRHKCRSYFQRGGRYMRKTCAKIANPRVFYALFLLLDGTGRNFVEILPQKQAKMAVLMKKVKNVELNFAI